MKNPNAPPPLDPPPTKAELTWWESCAYAMRVKSRVASFIIFGLFGMAIESHRAWHYLIVHPWASLGIFVFEGAVGTFLTTPFRRAYERQAMPNAIRNRRLRTALLARPPA